MRKCAFMLIAAALAALGFWPCLTIVSAQWPQTPPGGMSLIPGYTHQRLGGLDSEQGRIAKAGGLVITYDIGDNAGDKARGYAENSPQAWTFTVQGAHGERATVTVDEPRQVVIVTIGGHANFEAIDVQSKRDLAEMLAMAVTYDGARDLGLKSQRTSAGVMSLLPGYTHERRPPIESLRLRGRIAKPDGLVITYDIGHNAGNKARGYPHVIRDAWTFSLTGPHGDDVVVTVDETGQVAIVTIAGDANFTSENVRTKRDLAELLAMVLTYDQATLSGRKK